MTKAIADIGKVSELTISSFETVADSIPICANKIEPVWSTLATKEDLALDIDIIQRQLNKTEERIENLECGKANISEICYLHNRTDLLRDEIHNLEERIDRENININLFITDLREQLAVTIAELNSLKEQLFKKKENKNKMKNLNLDFGPCGNTVRLSMYGIAIQNINNEWVSYNPEKKEIVNVDILNIADGGKYVYKMPVAISDIAIGDIVIHNRVPMFITHIKEDGSFIATDVRAGESKCIIPTRSPFGFSFMTKIVSLFNDLMAPDKDNPFGNMWMFAMMSDDNNFDIKDMLMMSLMTGNNDFAKNMNPMMLMLMMDDKNEKNDWLMFLMLMNSGIMNQPHICQCAKPTVEAGQI